MAEPGGAGSRLAALVSAGISLALLVTVAFQFRRLDFAAILSLVPGRSAFWPVFAAWYLAEPLFDWVIYRRLWRVAWGGFAALLRKKVSNELLLGYLGEVQFYAWARSRLDTVAAPFAAVKDVTILSALTGNLATLAMLALSWRLVAHGQLGTETRMVFLSLGVVLVTSLAILLFRASLFSLPRPTLWWISAVHALRIAALIGLAAWMWHLVLPDVAFWLWLVLATLRMLVSRLPMIPNKDVVFAGLAVFLLGHEGEVGSLMTMMAGLLLIANIAVAALLAGADLARSRRRAA